MKKSLVISLLIASMIIELFPDSSDQKLPENFQVIIGVGSQYDYIVNPVYETFEVPLNIDYHNATGRVSCGKLSQTGEQL